MFNSCKSYGLLNKLVISGAEMQVWFKMQKSTIIIKETDCLFC